MVLQCKKTPKNSLEPFKCLRTFNIHRTRYFKMENGSLDYPNVLHTKKT